MGKIHIELKKLVYNTGQIEGVPRNPRKWTKEDVTALAASIVETPELFEARPLLVVPRGDRYIVIGGNMRLAAARELAMAMPPCYEIQDQSTENLKRMALKDNASFGEWDAVALADVRHYCGIDPDPDTHRGVQLMADTFLDYCKDSSVELIEAPFEDVTLDEGVYDMALTSPPYFDVEQYRGGSRRTKSSRNTSYGWRASIVHLSKRLTGHCGPEGTSASRWVLSRTRSATTRCA